MRTLHRFAILSFAALGATVATAQENYSTAWSGHKNVLINTTGTGAAVFANVTGFPILVRLGAADSNVFKQAKGNGADLRFTKSNNTTRIAHQIERWDSAGRNAAVWVRVDTVYGNRNNQHVRMHWGNAAAADSSNGTAVFRVADGFRAVWHMNDTGNVADATGRGMTAVANGAPGSATGMIGGARSFNGSSSYFDVTNSDTGLSYTVNSNYSVSAWINATALTAHGTVLSKSDFAYALKLQQGATWEFFEYNDGWNAAVATTPAEPSTWIHLIGVQNGPATQLYVNGVMENPDAILTAGGSGRNETIRVNIGREPQATGGRRYFNGVVDEVRVHGVSRNANWARLEYQTQRAGQTVVTLADNVPAIDTTAAPGAPTAVTATASTLVSGVATISWTAPTATGGAAITGYRAVAVSDTTKFCVTTVTTCVITGLTPQTAYTFTVRASNAVGAGPASQASASVTMPVSLRGSLVFQVAEGRNPFVFRLPAGISENTESLSLSVIDATGRLVWSRTVNPARDNLSRIEWNGKTASGMQASAGMYVVRARYTERGQTVERDLKGITLDPR